MKVVQLLPELNEGRGPSIDAGAIATLRAEGLGTTAIAGRLGIGRASVYRVLQASQGRTTAAA
jgi:DNA invertase Pin-like site-specific DNA recombinase